MKITTQITAKKSTFVMMAMLFAFILASNSMSAQKIEVKGIVKGETFEKTEVLNGASIFLKGTTVGTTSNKKGEFTFPKALNIGDVLEISYLGFIKKSIVIRKNSSILKITLIEDDNEMLGALNNNKRYVSKRLKQ